MAGCFYLHFQDETIFQSVAHMLYLGCTRDDFRHKMEKAHFENTLKKWPPAIGLLIIF